MLPSNVEDPRFRNEEAVSPERYVDWTAGSALLAEWSQPMDDLLLAARSPDRRAALVCCLVDLLGAVLGMVARRGGSV